MTYPEPTPPTPLPALKSCWPRAIWCGPLAARSCSCFLRLAGCRCEAMCYLEKVLSRGWRRFPPRCLGWTAKTTQQKTQMHFTHPAQIRPSLAQRCRSAHVRLSKCVTHLNLTLFSIPLASSWVTPIKDSLLMAMSWSPGLKRPSCREKEKAADVTTEIVCTESSYCLSSKRQKYDSKATKKNSELLMALDVLGFEMNEMNVKRAEFNHAVNSLRIPHKHAERGWIGRNGMEMNLL